MNREEFMMQLERLLADIPETERVEALEYYSSYFDDAGPENEGKVIGELGSPGKVAAMIKADLREGSESYGEYTERGYEDSRMREDAQVPGRYGERLRRQGHRTRTRDNRNRIILLVILVICAAPILLGIGSGLIGVFFGILGGIIGLVFGIFGLLIGALFGGAGLVIDGIVTCFGNLPAGFLEIGCGFLGLALGMLLLAFFVWVIRRGIPWLIDKISHLVQGTGERIRNRRGGAEE